MAKGKSSLRHFYFREESEQFGGLPHPMNIPINDYGFCGGIVDTHRPIVIHRKRGVTELMEMIQQFQMNYTYTCCVYCNP
ncbi:uncharacterized protein PHALS_12314 [Plasmopara halstedii]|uniref:Uncharacterized protein n=1 Tax=Plasmopara halstedii TaxID=4781 RepID=A0A0P1ALZ0_PLAHL|nr:uncharacterized protein PHALS_12314 [Plasmopara halstedii]CEG42007.1 hypothetical protein PHALS_12314 [Plasmopara halstedii]|eukprot:XP_024578376.1 hypothetical protein PHALS_12314 [Plasmopara halstedii]